jgi:hypothetical protein
MEPRMRAPSFDDANFALRLYELRREHELRKARNLIGELSMASWDDLQEVMDWGNKRNAHFRQATSYWEMCASFVNRGIFHPDVFLDTCGEALFTYVTFVPWLAKIREQSPRFLVQLEKAVNENQGLKDRVGQIEKMMAAWKAETAAAESSEKPSKADKKKDRKKAKK